MNVHIRSFVLLLFLVFSFFNAQEMTDAQGLNSEASKVMFSDPAKAIKICQYITQNNSSSSSEDIYQAYIIQAEIYLYQKQYADVIQKLVDADRISSRINNNFLKLKVDYILANILLELHLYVAADNLIDKNLIKASTKRFDKNQNLYLQNILKELNIKELYFKGKFTDSEKEISRFKIENTQLDLFLQSRIKIIQRNISLKRNRKAEEIQTLITNSYYNFLMQILLMREQNQNISTIIDKTENLRNEYPQYNELLFLDLYKEISDQACSEGAADFCFKYRNKYTKLLNLSFEDKQKARVGIINLIEQRERENSSSEEIRFQYILFAVGSVALTLIIFAAIYFFSMQKRFEKRHAKEETEKIYKEYEQKIDQLKDLHTSQPFSIPEKTEKLILSKLEHFESGNEMTDSRLSLSLLAKKMDTNSKYLSEIINKHKHKNFNTYVNELRINYIIDKIKNHPEYMNYKTSYLAEESGFTSRTSFTTIFKSITGKSPSVYIDELRGLNDNISNE